MNNRKFKITYVKTTRANAKRYTEEILASSKYNAKQRFYLVHPPYEIVSVEEVENDGKTD